MPSPSSTYTRTVFRGSNKGEHRKEPKPTTDAADGKDSGFPTLDGYLMIFGGSAAYDSKRHQRITFKDPSNYRMETLTFEVVGFHGTYHAILGHPCYVKFMAVPNYTYLKLKMPSPSGVITAGTSF